MNIFELDKRTNTRICVTYARGVLNTEKLRECVLSGNLDCCILKSQLILDIFQVVVAANKAAVGELQNRMRTKSVNVELAFNLSPSKNISESLNTFCAQDNDRSVIFVEFLKNENKKSVIAEKIEGDICELDKISQDFDRELVKKIYKLSAEEERSDSILDCVISRIATKE